MHAFSRWMALATLLSGVAAHADKNDLQISNLGRPGVAGSTANADFQAFSRAFAASLSSVNLMPPETLGHAAFNLSAELAVVSLPKARTEENGDVSGITIPMEADQPSTMLVPSLHVRKGLPFSVELGGRVGWVERSRLLAITGEAKWAVNEGFTGGGDFITYLPDIGVRGHITRLLGAQDFGLSSLGVDVGAGKQFPLGGMVTLTPYGGLDFNFVRATSDLLLFDSPSQEDPNSLLDNSASYKTLKFSDNMTQRIYGGARFIGGVLQLGAEISFTRLGNVKLTDAENSDTRGLPTIVTFNTSLGLDF